MNKLYDWVCSDCGATNAAASESCQKCGCPAASSAADIERRRLGIVVPKSILGGGQPLSRPKSAIAAVLLVVMIAGVVLERFTAPTMMLWWVALAMAIGAGLPLFAMLKVRETLPKQTSSRGDETDPIGPPDSVR